MERTGQRFVVSEITKSSEVATPCHHNSGEARQMKAVRGYYTIWKRFRFSASHQLFGLPEGHQCGRLHGHNYVVEVELSSDALDANGFVVDFGELKPIKEFIDGAWDHRHLNDFFDDCNPTAENMACTLYWICFNKYPQISAVRVQETETSWAEYRP